MTAYTWNHLQCNGCPNVHTTSTSKDGKKLPGATSGASAGWKIKYQYKGIMPNQTRTRFDFCPTCVKYGKATVY